MIPHIKQLLGKFHYRVSKRFLGQMKWYHLKGTWEYPTLGYAMRVYGLKDIETCISRNHNMVVQYIAWRWIGGRGRRYQSGSEIRVE